MINNLKDIESLIQSAVSLHQNQKFDEAKKIYEKVLKINPKQSEVIHLLGLIEKQRGNTNLAIQLINSAIKIESRNPVYYFNLANTYKSINEKQNAINAYKKVIELEPRYFEAYSNMGLLFQNMGELENAITNYSKALELNPNSKIVLNNLSCVHLKQGKYKEAKSNIERLLAIDPSDESAKHIFSALNGDTPENANPKYVSALFDEYSSYFEHDLVQKLEYKIPRLIRELLDEKKRYNILDLGCGTGLIGKTLSDINNIVDGIDLSAKMIEEANKKKIYKNLWVGDIVEILKNIEKFYNLVVAADVFVYIGKLEHIFQVVNKKLENEGLFVFSIENLISSNKYELRLSGRYAHSVSYIECLAKDFGFEIMKQKLVEIRKENNKKIEGVLFLLKKTGVDG